MQINNIKHYGSYNNKYLYQPALETWYWGNTYLDEETGTLHLFQGQVTCKDYIIDTTYRPTSSSVMNEEVMKQFARTPYFYIYIKSTDLEQQQKIQRNIETLKAWEKKNGYQEIEYTTKVITETNVLMYVFKTDPFWWTASTFLSFYLSIFRVTLRTGDLFGHKLHISASNCGESDYYAYCTDEWKQLYDYLIKYPRFIKKYSKKCDAYNRVVGAKLASTPVINAHGVMGFFSESSYNRGAGYYVTTLQTRQNMYWWAYLMEAWRTRTPAKKKKAKTNVKVS